MVILLCPVVSAECRDDDDNKTAVAEIEEMFAAASEIEERIDSRSFWKKMFSGGDLHNGRELKQAVEDIKARFGSCCKCDTEEQRKLLNHYEAKAVMEINRKGLFGWFRGFY